MTTLSDDGDRICPLCAEEMDLTDQQLKPCKCGYEICVWCWHHIMEMAEKEGSDGRCPACRTAYDKKRIVGMAANCKRMVAEISADKKQKTQKTKNKSSSTIEDRKHLSSVRVVQKNLVYIMGMPSNLSDENILERKEYFGQYGKILKVSVSKQAGLPPNSNTFSVYVTYAREEDAVRCIQAVHNFVLEGKSLRACFGTTKYCYTWLRNQSCNNPDCLYLHDIGSQEDSFTKDEIISAYTRSRVPQIPSCNLQLQSGNVLPPPVDDVYNNGPVSAKQSTKSSFNNTTSQVKGSPIDASGARSTVLPAAASWGSRASNYQPAASSIVSSQNSLKQKIEVLNNSSSSSMASSTKQNSAWLDDAVTGSKIPEGRPVVHKDGRFRVPESLKHVNARDQLAKASDVSPGSSVEDQTSCSAWDDDVTVVKVPDGLYTTQANGRARNLETSRPANAASVPRTPEEIVLDEDHHSAWDDETILTTNMLGERQVVHYEDGFRSAETLEPGIGLSRTFSSDITSKDFLDAVCSSGVSISCSPGQLSLPQESTRRGATASIIVNTDPINIIYSEGAAGESSSSSPNELSNFNAAVSGNIESLCLGLSSVNLDTHFGIDRVNTGQQQYSVTGEHLAGNFEIFNSSAQQCYPENGTEYLASVPVSNASLIPDAHASDKLSDWSSELQKQVLSSTGSGTTDALAATNDQRQRLSMLTNLPSSSLYKAYSLNVPSHLVASSQNGDLADKRCSVSGDSRFMGAEMSSHSESLFLNGHKEQMPNNFAKSERVFEFLNGSYSFKELRSSGSDNASHIERNSNIDTEEESIVSKMLSPDFDPWDNSWSSANNFAKLLAQMIKPEGPSKQLNSWKLQNTNQSRFSFARQETQANLGDSSYRDFGLAQQLSLKQDSYGNCFGNTYPIGNFERANVLGGSSSTISSDINAGVTRTKISAPPGFSVPNGAPPPGFSSQDRYDQAFNACSETQLLGGLLQNQFQVHSTSSAGDVEFIDPAILAVGKGRLPLGVDSTVLGCRSMLDPQFGTSENDTRIQLLAQQSISTGQNPRISHIGERFLQLDDTCTSSRFSAQNPSLSPFAQTSHQQPSHILNSQWNGWNDVQIGNSTGVPEVLRSERFGLSNYFPVNDEPKFDLPCSGDIYNRASEGTMASHSCVHCQQLQERFTSRQESSIS